MAKKIKQCCMTDHQEQVFSGFMKRYSLSSYKDKNSPAVFYSLWGMRNLSLHKSLAVIVWRGTDITKISKVKIKKIKRMKNIYHVAISSYIAKDLDNLGIPYKFIPIVGADVKDFKPISLGKEIYAYVPNLNHSQVKNKYRERYNYKLIKKIRNKCGFKINITTGEREYSRRKIRELYARCFCGFRFTKHDGLPNQVVEMGLMGRKSFYNGDIPGSIRWNENNVNEIIDNIKKESKNIGKNNYEFANQIKKFIDIDDDWLNIKYWKK
jgi:hypothetical protein